MELMSQKLGDICIMLWPWKLRTKLTFSGQKVKGQGHSIPENCVNAMSS